MRIRHVELPYEIYGQNLSGSWRLWHGSDVTRIRIKMQYGGIYLDNDMYVVQNLDQYPKFEMVMGWDDKQPVGNQVFIGHKDARLLPLFLDTYREYHAESWYYNGGERLTAQVLEKRPELLHRVKLKLEVHVFAGNLYIRHWKEWRDQPAIHLLTGHTYYLDPRYTEFPTFNETMIKTCNYTFGEMACDLLGYLEP